ncbi:hypothetical protein SCHPADRAFT_173307 [Schizopora paradoxa]|uniref:FIST domain-containing protein n=1 Tax=Schizopora paradoxa TaxID=27342 RepID=A0A0H2RYY2_9AGAM|nr:hypothetical protein SCHPADRAFT_173307 [Schizopora paradoxa]
MLRSATWLLRSKAQLRQVLDATFSASPSNNHALMYALSSDAPDLEDIIGELSRSAPETVGCITSPLPFHPDTTFASPFSLPTLGEETRRFSCALTLVDRDQCVPFALENKFGEGPVQVGRWHAFRKRDVKDGGLARLLEQNGDDWNDVWKGSSSRDLPELPEEFQDRKDINSFVYFTDNSSMNIANSLHHSYPSSTTLRLIAAPTPFINGMPFTLIRNGRAQPTGAVGLAILRSKQEVRQRIGFNGLKELYHPLKLGGKHHPRTRRRALPCTDHRRGASSVSSRGYT